MHFSRAHAKH
jgi:curved DNA-binding protein CbpA